MEGSKDNINKIFIATIYIYFLTGVLWHLLPVTKNIVIKLTPYGLAILSLTIFLFNAKRFNAKTVIWIATVFLFTIIVEIIGVNTALVFGDYVYSDVLGFKLFGVPLIIGLNWTIIILGLVSLTDNLVSTNIIFHSILIGAFAVLFDIILEPVALKLNYWEWETLSIPFKNYLSWFIIAFILGLAGFKIKAKFSSRYILHYIFAQFLFLCLLNLFL